ncbi:divergent polysaccharide deacetylase family protein [candidate division KSB1 bacterium]|nr:divergent polysaccharide deacetylase family protein [candidate division KSB1 bacterium]
MNLKHGKNKTESPSFLRILLIIGIIGVIIIAISEIFFRKPADDKTPDQVSEAEYDDPQKMKILIAINEVLLENNLQADWISKEGGKKVVRVPNEIPLIKICQDVVHCVQEQDGQILKSYEEIRTGEIVLEIGYKRRIIQVLRFKHDSTLHPRVGKIALIIDDFGHAFTQLVQNFLELDAPITISILPGLPESQHIAERALISGKEIMLHLPMESKVEKTPDHGYTIYTSMGDAEIKRRAEAAIRHLTSIKGVNNHQGSKATADSRTISAVLEAIKNYNLFFIDSQTDKSSLAFELAKQMKIPTSKRDVFLDNKDDLNYIRGQIDLLARIASRNGSATGIGHLKTNTYKALREELPRLKNLGYQIIFASEIVQ